MSGRRRSDRLLSTLLRGRSARLAAAVVLIAVAMAFVFQTGSRALDEARDGAGMRPDRHAGTARLWRACRRRAIPVQHPRATSPAVRGGCSPPVRGGGRVENAFPKAFSYTAAAAIGEAGNGGGNLRHSTDSTLIAVPSIREAPCASELRQWRGSGVYRLWLEVCLMCHRYWFCRFQPQRSETLVLFREFRP